MKEAYHADPAAVAALFQKLQREAAAAGYHLNPDQEFTMALVEGLLVNSERYGAPVCPCRLASDIAEEDRDIVCPCDYRDPDLNDFGSCFCALYVSEKIARGEAKPHSIRDRRPRLEERRASAKAAALAKEPPQSLRYPVWRCNVCGYLCARENPPEICPICKARHDRFERFL
ncbi:ferredoxin-thioredoxin reductase catalytic subunit [Hydrogenispora ethanolica]|jgi:ferredoxin-thioredoxin reductase catalytic subunit|uniref:ferredoxin:thioredoxin reductase n=1 Tax=Hydrogenispora ethanolica TaxID=1082276 RepID=A0A4R1RSN2_HYDET|nr:ferredoxin-thioredoxin reductase catalytic domain-containing protein [Hydrogenispora ethanolica]TCL69329.1 ferredoxin-thioredoxin reductase catalytic subunit [Hydrogenispora ethanolica]